MIPKKIWEFFFAALTKLEVGEAEFVEKETKRFCASNVDDDPLNLQIHSSEREIAISFYWQFKIEGNQELTKCSLAFCQILHSAPDRIIWNINFTNKLIKHLISILSTIICKTNIYHKEKFLFQFDHMNFQTLPLDLLAFCANLLCNIVLCTEWYFKIKFRRLSCRN